MSLIIKARRHEDDELGTGQVCQFAWSSTMCEAVDDFSNLCLLSLIISSTPSTGEMTPLLLMWCFMPSTVHEDKD
jgi:hypothetical protein